jgi:hypothetical protein
MTLAFLLRAVVSGLLIAAIALLARRSPAMGALMASLPLISTLSILWLWHDTHDPKLMADYIGGTLWYFIPSLPMFVLMPYLLRHGIGFWETLTSGIGLTLVLYALTVWIAARYGVKL